MLWYESIVYMTRNNFPNWVDHYGHPFICPNDKYFVNITDRNVNEKIPKRRKLNFLSNVPGKRCFLPEDFGRRITTKCSMNANALCLLTINLYKRTCWWNLWYLVILKIETKGFEYLTQRKHTLKCPQILA